MKELLTQKPAQRIAAPLLALTLLCLTAGASSLSGAVLLHRDVEIAQGEHPFN